MCRLNDITRVKDGQVIPIREMNIKEGCKKGCRQGIIHCQGRGETVEMKLRDG